MRGSAFAASLALSMMAFGAAPVFAQQPPPVQTPPAAPKPAMPAPTQPAPAPAPPAQPPTPFPAGAKVAYINPQLIFQQSSDGKAAVAYVFNSMLPFEGLLEYVLEELKVPEPGSSPAQRLLALRRFMLDRRRAGQSTVLVLDEAQNLDVPTLERIRMLSNFETPTEKLLQILLVGQPELRAKLQRPELRQLQQRIELQCSLPPLSPEQTRDYIQTRLRVAGARVLDLFSDRAQTRIAKYSRGIPRRVNILCDHCLVIGYADQRRRIGVDVVDQAIAALDAPARRPARQTTSLVGAMRERWILGAVAAAVLAGVAVSPLRIEATQFLTLVRHMRDLFLP